MILTVTPNPALDITYQVAQLLPGATHRVEIVHARAGGKGVNVSRVLRHMGVDGLAITTAGGATGEELVHDIVGSGLPHKVVRVTGRTRRTVTVTDGFSEPTLFSEAGRALTERELSLLVTAVTAQLEYASVLVCSGSLPPDTDPSLYGALVDEAHKRGVPVVVDTSGLPLDLAIKAGADIITPNLTELGTVSGGSTPLVAARELRERGASSVVVTLGAKGMLAVVAEGEFQATLPEPLTGNPTGAGDAVVAALSRGLSEGMSWPDRLRLAIAWSAGAVTETRAGDVDPQTVDRASICAQVKRLPVTGDEHQDAC